ncbi:MAG TPA: hypothetical protein VHM20_00290 [Gammaproteobacteria bacterium]|jgi:hypothetical protein|nr:hypothetical protein [Gammaproteobacteria bacterium]
MKKIIGIVSLLLSLNVLAGTENLNSNLLTTFNQKISLPQPNTPLTLIYGGQDMSHPLVAIANESIWAGPGGVRIG